MIFVIPSVHSILCSVFVRGAGKGKPGWGLPIFDSSVKQVWIFCHIHCKKLRTKILYYLYYTQFLEVSRKLNNIMKMSMCQLLIIITDFKITSFFRISLWMCQIHNYSYILENQYFVKKFFAKGWMQFHVCLFSCCLKPWIRFSCSLNSVDDKRTKYFTSFVDLSELIATFFMIIQN
jgi:hypothetical protein